MKDIAEILCFKMYGITFYQVNIINVRTGMYYNSSSRYFDNKKEAIEFARENELTIKTNLYESERMVCNTSEIDLAI